MNKTDLITENAVLDDWLIYIQNLHVHAIDMGLERVRSVAAHCGLLAPNAWVITVAGTNGKGSTVAFLEAILRAQGYQVGAYTSPHIVRYNERIRLQGIAVDDATLIAAFQHIEKERGGGALTYFEYGTLAALEVFKRNGVDVMILEVGLGGRLDAVNMIDADVSIVTTVDIDHQDLLGSDRELIAIEKAGVFRSKKPAICAEPEPPQSLLAQAQCVDAITIRLGVDYFVDIISEAGEWTWRYQNKLEVLLPAPSLRGFFQYQNAAAALAALHVSQAQLPTSEQAWKFGISNAQIEGRLQLIQSDPEIWVDVGHNPQAARELALWLSKQEKKPCIAVFSALKDKNIEQIAAPFVELVQAWVVLGLEDQTNRGLSARDVALKLRQVTLSTPLIEADSARSALVSAQECVGKMGRVIVFGSFYTVSAVLEAQK